MANQIREGQAAVKRAYFCNWMIAGMVLLSAAWMFSGFLIGDADAALNCAGWGMLKYYTIDSNLLMGVAAVVSALEERAVLHGKKAEMRPWVSVLKLCGVTGVTLTMLVTVFFLAPGMQDNWIACFQNSLLFMHLLTPILSLVVFLVWERTALLSWKAAFFGIVSVTIYGIYYVINCIVHAVGDDVPAEYDWYGFASAGLKRALTVVVPMIVVISYAIALGLWRANRRKIRKSEEECAWRP